MNEQVSAVPRQVARNDQASGDAGVTSAAGRPGRKAVSPGRRMLLPIAVFAALASLTGLLGAQYILARQEGTRLQRIKAAGTAFLSVPTPDTTEAQHEKLVLEQALATAVADRVAGQPDWQIVEQVLEVSRETGVSVQMEGIRPGNVTRLAGAEYYVLPFALSARGNVPNLWLFLSTLPERFETLDIQSAVLSQDANEYRLNLGAAVYREPELTPAGIQALGVDVAADAPGPSPGPVGPR